VTEPADKTVRNACGPRVRIARRRAVPKVSQADLSARLATYGVDLNQASISKIEKQTRIVTDAELVALAAALAVRVGWLVNEQELP
jgi:hypothetical protein